MEEEVEEKSQQELKVEVQEERRQEEELLLHLLLLSESVTLSISTCGIISLASLSPRTPPSPFRSIRGRGRM